MLLLRGFEPLSHPRTESSGVVWGGPSPPALARRVGCLEGLVMAQTVRCWLERGMAQTVRCWLERVMAQTVRCWLERVMAQTARCWPVRARCEGVGTRGSLDPCRDVPRVPATLVP